MLIGYFSFGSVLASMARVGWGGFVLTIVCQLALFMPLGLAWLLVAPTEPVERLGWFSWGRLIREAASDVLPFSQVGGFLVGARAIVAGGVTSGTAFGSGVVDVTFEMFAQMAYTLFGVVLLVARLGAASRTDRLVWMLVLGLFVMAAIGGAMVLIQRKGAALAERIAGHVMPAAAVHAARVGQAVDEAYARPIRLWSSWTVHVCCWFGSALSTWLILSLIGQHLSFLAVVAIESLLYAIRNAAFFVPGGIGVQEGAYALLGPLFGLPSEAALALSLLKRSRDIAIGVPALLIWQLLEGRRPGRMVADA